jgi:polysaccharide export outer membrane protein
MHSRSLWIATFVFPLAALAQDAHSKPPAGFAERDPRYRIQANDVLDIQFRYTPEFNFTATVQPDGFIASQIAGSVRVGGLTVDEACAAIAKPASARLKDPEVNIILKDFVKPHFVVAGEVNHPGTFDLHGEVSLVQAIAISGGFKDSARRTQVILFRKANPEYAEVKVYDLRKIMSPGQIREDAVVKPGDMLVVPRNHISRMEPYLRLTSLGMWGLTMGIP